VSSRTCSVVFSSENPVSMHTVHTLKIGNMKFLLRDDDKGQGFGQVAK